MKQLSIIHVAGAEGGHALIHWHFTCEWKPHAHLYDPPMGLHSTLTQFPNSWPGAGTKGKGSTCAMAESMLRQCGYRTGLFTSPHLIDVRERIRING